MSDVVIVALISGLIELVGMAATVVGSARSNRRKSEKAMAKQLKEYRDESNMNDGIIREALDSLSQRFDLHVESEQLKDIKQRRVRILRVSDDIMNGVEVGEEMCLDALEDIYEYRAYCDSHPDYHNHKGINAMKNIEAYYDAKYRFHPPV